MASREQTKEEATSRKQEEMQREKMITDNLGLVHMVANRFLNRGYDREELFQVGVIGLMKAVDHFEEDRGMSFSTYAVPTIMGEIRRFLRDDGMIHVSRQLKLNGGKIESARQKFIEKWNREPYMEELITLTGLEKEDIFLALSASQSVLSVDASVSAPDGEGKATTLGDYIEDARVSQERWIEELALRQELAGLDQVEKDLIRLRYWKGKTQRETAEKLGLNQVAVSRLEKKILLYLRKQFAYNKE